VTIRDADDCVETFSHVVVATHADTALSLLANPTAREAELLGAIRYSRNHTVLHTDDRLLPRTPRAQSSWNYRMSSCATSSAEVMVSYDMNRLQHLETSTPYVVSLNASDRVEPAHIVAEMEYEHPIYDIESVSAVRQLSELNDGQIAFAGAYQGWGFHEDGCRSGAEAARSLGVEWRPR
jgi:predicted NAD/FAD-binding protein